MAIQTHGGIHIHSLGIENCRFDKLYSIFRHIVDDLVELFGQIYLLIIKWNILPMLVEPLSTLRITWGY